MRENLIIISTKTIQIGLVLLAFLVPIFFLPTTSEFYNFNKTVLLTVGAFFLFFVWGIRMVAEERVRITRTALDIPLLIFLGIYIIASVFSVDPVVSFLGWHPVFFGSLPSIAAVVTLYFLATTHLDSTYRNAVLIALGISATILSFLFLSYYFGHPIIGTDFAQARNWTAAGDLNKLVSFLAIAIPTTLAISLQMKEGIGRFIGYALTAVQIIALTLINSLFGFIVLIVAGLVVLIFLPRLSFKTDDKIVFGVLGAIIAILLLLTNIKGLGNAVLKPLISGEDKSVSITKPIRLPVTAAWQTGAQSLANRPIFGSGPSTFGLVYPSFKPISINRENDSNLWNIRFDESSSGVLDIVTTTGVVGILAFVLIVVVLLRSVVKFSARGEAARGRNEFVFLQAAMLAALSSLLIFNLSALNTFALILLAAIFFSTLRDWGSNLAGEVNLELVALRSGAIRQVEGGSKAPNSLGWAFFLPALILFAAILFYSWSSYVAEFYYQNAIVASGQNKGNETRNNLVAAIKANPYRDTYHRALLVTDLALARSLNQQGEKISEEQQNTLLALVREAVDQGRIITGYEGRGLGSFQIKRVPGTGTTNVANWESVATVYANIGGELRNDASVHAVNTYSQAIRLDPTNPRLYEALGSVYFSLNDMDNAIRNFEFATQVKPDYASGHYNLAQAVRNKDDNPARVVQELQATLILLKENKDSNKDQITRIEKELKDAQKKLKEVQPAAEPEKLQPQTKQPQSIELKDEATPSAKTPSPTP